MAKKSGGVFMIRNRLAELLSERQLKITKVAKDTGISRNTITSTAQNDTKMIQYDTIDVLCQYLNITPNDFFDFIPVDYSLSFFTENVSIIAKTDSYYDSYVDKIEYEFILYIDIKGYGFEKTFELLGKLWFNDENDLIIHVDFSKEEDSKEFTKKFYDKISAGHRTLFDKEVHQTISLNFAKDLKEQQPDLLDKNYYLEFISTIKPLINLKWEFPF